MCVIEGDILEKENQFKELEFVQVNFENGAIKDIYNFIKSSIKNRDTKEVVYSRSADILRYHELAYKYMTEKKFTDELQVLGHALRISPNNAATLIQIGRCFRSLGMLDDAIDVYQKVIAINPQMGAVYTNLGVVYWMKNNYLEAIKHYRLGLSLLDRDSADYWIGYANYALVIGDLGNLKRADKMISEAELHGYKNGNACRLMLGIDTQ